MTATTVSSDGTTIAYEKSGTGPAVVLVDGALCHRAFGPSRPLAERLAKDYTVYIYDRRGRGASGDIAPYSSEREVDDLAAVIKAAGGEAYVFSISSGAALVLEAAGRDLPITKAAVYEIPLIAAGGREWNGAEYAREMDDLVANGKRGKAVKHFMRDAVEIPAPFVAMMSVMPMWPKLKRVAHTLPYDHALLGDTAAGHESPLPRWSQSETPTLVMGGGKSPDWMQQAQVAIAGAIPRAEHRTIAGQTHMLKPDVIAPVLREYFR
jgi:pimeloyl-ACP methyl ester carboxylesterase